MKAPKPFHHEDAENTEKPVGNDLGHYQQRSVLGFQHDNGGNRVRRRYGQLNNKALSILGKLERLFRTRQEISSLNGLTPGWYLKAAVDRPVKHLQINPARLARSPSKFELCGTSVPHLARESDPQLLDQHSANSCHPLRQCLLGCE